MYKVTANTKGYGEPRLGTTTQAKKLYNPNFGMTLLKSVTNNENSTAKNKVIFSSGPVTETLGVRGEDPLSPGEYARNPLNQRGAMASSILLSGIGLMGLLKSAEHGKKGDYGQAALYGAIAATGFGLMPDWELRI